MILLAPASPAHAQWDIEESHSTASLRGISSVGAGVAWASGANGAVLRTEDGGYLWQTCAPPSGAGKLDFRAIHGFDANTALVMSSGLGDLSRLYLTTDGCATWKLLLANTDRDAFWDAMVVADLQTIMILGDPIDGAFQIQQSEDGGQTWTLEKSQPTWPREAAFAASNSALSIDWENGPTIFGTGSPAGARIYRDKCDPCKGSNLAWSAVPIPWFPWGESAGIFAIHQSTWDHIVAVGGDYKKPDDATNNSAWSLDGGRSWHRSETWPHGYRSAVDYNKQGNFWITVGPNGTDVSRDDGRNWQPLAPGPTEPEDADKNWNALSLPFAVGSKGRIGRLRPIDFTKLPQVAPRPEPAKPQEDKPQDEKSNPFNRLKKVFKKPE
ncbi:MAG TPA: hypothetical protein VHZ52_09760 [Acidobacteriaceae bacterium]|nr:hypothetical protein [Acidobacteriaceae bacterium]